MSYLELEGLVRYGKSLILRLTIYVLKVIQYIPSGSLLAERVRLEAEVSIPSQYIIPVVGLRQWNSTTFLLLFEYFPGYSLDRFLTYNTLSSSQKRHIFYQILLGVADAHRCNIIHRDLKPANILLRKVNNNENLHSL